MAPRKPPGPRPADPAQRLLKSLDRLGRVVGRLVSDVDDVRTEQSVQLKRMGQMQAELDAVKRAWEEMHGPSKS